MRKKYGKAVFAQQKQHFFDQRYGFAQIYRCKNQKQRKKTKIKDIMPNKSLDWAR